MATFTSSWRKYGSGGQWRLILVIDDPPSSISSGTSSVSLSAQLRIQTTHSLSDTSNSNALSGTLGSSSGSASVSHGSGGGTTTVRNVGPTAVATQYGQTVKVTVAGSISGYEAFGGGTYSVEGSVTIPARPHVPPAAPTNVVPSRVSDTQVKVTWSRTASTSSPVTWQHIQRRHQTAGGWSAWTTVGSVTTTHFNNGSHTYTDTTTVANRCYQYRVVAYNGSGQTYSSNSAFVYTTPAAPTGATATRSGGNIVVTWKNQAGYAVFGTEVYHSAGGGAWTLMTTRGAAAESWTHTAPDPAVTHRYRVRHVTTSGPTLASSYSATSTVQLAAPPNAPTGLTGPSIRDATEDAVWRWVHNPIDSSAQEQFEVRHRPAGGAWTTVGPITSSESRWTLPAGTYPNPVTVEWQVRTWGQHADPSPWSATAVSPTSSRPTVVVNDPEHGTVVDASSLTVHWGYAQAEESPQAGWTVELRDADGEVVEEKAGAGTAAATALGTVLPDGSTWTVRVQVQSAAGLFSAWDEATFTVEYPLPPTPTVALSWDGDTGTVSVEVHVPEPVDEEVEAVHVDVYRSINDGPWQAIATGVPVGTAVTDWTPTVAGTNRYRAEAVSALPSVATSEVAVQVTPEPGDQPSVWLSGGPAFSQVCRASTNVTIGEQAGRATKVLHRFAGRRYPVEIAGAALDRVLTLSVDLLTGKGIDSASSPPADWLALAELPGPHLWRDYSGRYVLVSISPVATSRRPDGQVTSLSLTATQVDDG